MAGHPSPPVSPPLSRRNMLRRAGLGFGTWALLDLLKRDGLRADTPSPARAKHVIFLFMQGGPSHIDTFDPKPLLAKRHGQPLPAERHRRGCSCSSPRSDAAILGSPQTFRKCGRSGIEIADTYPHLQTCADDLAVVRSCYHDSFNHAPAQYMLNTGYARMGRPCLGSWVTYGLGSESENLPAFVVMATTGDVKGGPPVYGRGFLPGTYQPTVLRNAGSPVLYLERRRRADDPDRREVLDMVQWLNREHRAARGDGRGRPVLAHRLLRAGLPHAERRARGRGPDPGDARRRRTLYGLDDPISAQFGADCLMARRLVERGVRFVQIFTGSAGADDWDAAHAENDKTHREMARRVDRPIAGLLQGPEGAGPAGRDAGDLGRRIRPDAGRRRPLPRQAAPAATTTPTASPPGWPAAASRAAGSSAPPTSSASGPSRTGSTSTTCTPRSCKLLGLDHRELTYLFQGRDQRLTDVGGDHEFAERLLNP